MCDTPGVRKGRQIISENLGNTFQIFQIHFVCQLMLVKNLATNTGAETKQSQISWWTALSTSGNSQHCTTSCTTSFRDLRATAEKEFELHHRINLPKSVSKCQENCGRPIKVEEVMVVRSYGRVAWTDKSTGEEKARFGPMYIHFHENCLKNFSDTFFAPSQSFDFSTKKIYPKTQEKLTEEDKTLLLSLGIK